MASARRWQAGKRRSEKVEKFGLLPQALALHGDKNGSLVLESCRTLAVGVFIAPLTLGACAKEVSIVVDRVAAPVTPGATDLRRSEEAARLIAPSG
jgi:hypothetical protein